jgi:hypothetical protein
MFSGNYLERAEAGNAEADPVGKTVIIFFSIITFYHNK